MTDMLETPEAFATKHHAGQERKYTGLPYITHPLAVRALVATVPHTQAMLDAAVLHDVVEDTAATLEEVELLFGPDVAELVSYLTDVSTLDDGSRAIRKELDRQHLAGASPNAQTIKLADLIHNTSNIVDNDPVFARVYLGEKALLLQVLTKGDPKMYALAVATMNEALAKLDTPEGV